MRKKRFQKEIELWKTEIRDGCSAGDGKPNAECCRLYQKICPAYYRYYLVCVRKFKKRKKKKKRAITKVKKVIIFPKKEKNFEVNNKG